MHFVMAEKKYGTLARDGHHLVHYTPQDLEMIKAQDDADGSQVWDVSKVLPNNLQAHIDQEQLSPMVSLEDSEEED